MSTESPSHNHHHHDPAHRQHRHTANDGSCYFRTLIWGLYKHNQYTDFTICVNGSVQEFHVHRAVICPQSKILEAACRGGFIEASTNSITLADDPDIVETMIRYFYTHRYDDKEDWKFECCDSGIKRIQQHYSEMGVVFVLDKKYDDKGNEKENESDEEEMQLSYLSKHGHDNSRTNLSPTSSPKSLHVYAIADKYLINPLKDLARTRFTHWVSCHWWTKGFVAAAREIFDNETGNYEDLKEVILSAITLHADTLLCGRINSSSNNKDRDEESEINKFMQDYNEVGFEVLRRTLDRTRIRQRGLEVEVADLESKVNSLKIENKKISVLQSRNNILNKELLEIKTVVLAWKKDLKDFSGGNSKGSGGGQSTSRVQGQRGNSNSNIS